MSEKFVHPYIPNSAPEVQAEMLKSIGAKDIEEFFACIPEALRVKGLLDLPKPFLSEASLKRHVEGILSKNRTIHAAILSVAHTFQVQTYAVSGSGARGTLTVLGAIAQSDIKRMLSFTLVSHIGYMVLGIAVAGTSVPTA